MKLLLAGSTGFIGTEILRQALLDARITSVVVLGRRPVPAPTSTDASKLQTVVVHDLGGSYAADVLEHLADAESCIWSIGVPPTQALANDLDYVKRVCQDYPLNLMQNIIHARAGKPFRYVHVSGVICQRDQTKRPLWKPDYCLLGGRMETTILVQRGAASGFDVCVARPGMVTERRTLKHVLTSVTFMPAIDIRELAAALLHQAYVGFEKDTVENRELMQVGRAALRLNV